MTAVRSLAVRMAAGSRHFGPSSPTSRNVPRDATRSGKAGSPRRRGAAGLARVLATAFRRERAALVVCVLDGLSSHGETVPVAGCEWLAYRAAIGGGWSGPKRAGSSRCGFGCARKWSRSCANCSARERSAKEVYAPPIAGRPHPFSWAEQAPGEARCGSAPGHAGGRGTKTYPSVSQLSLRFRPDLDVVRGTPRRGNRRAGASRCSAERIRQVA